MATNAPKSGTNEGLESEQIITELDELLLEFREYIVNNGYKKAITILRSINHNKEEALSIDTYDFIIRTVISIYDVTENDLYNNRSKFVATDARRTAYVLLNKYLNYTQKNIAVQFGKSREAINFSMIEFDKMIEDDFYKNTFRKKHEAVEKIVEAHINKRKSENEKSEKTSLKSKNKE